MSPAAALYLYRAIYVGFIVFASAKTLIEGWPAPHGGASAGHMARFVTGLASVEILAAAAFLWPPVQLWAGAALLAIFAVATVVDLAHGGAPVRFAYYSATVLIILFLSAKGSAAQA